ncbi:hypothetical protein [Actinoplanes sp. M2I2]|uniref:DUF7674 family protein n=1 Tax=Actinoplanes sp. M2I2 TaxID=1734444 RepID=UPI0020203D28|nr:hypothetical protein [Actinoplanes sp. M2I2]
MTLDLSYGGVVGTVVEAVPELRAALDEHVRDNGEVLPHVFFACDLAPFVLAAWQAGDAEVLGRCLAVLEAALTSPDRDTWNLVAVSFVEAVGPWEPEIKAWAAGWPPALAAQAATYA